MTKTIAFIQARMSSSRFPGKVLLPLGGVPMIVYMARRARKARLLDDAVVVTSTNSSDDALVNALVEAQIPVFRGHLENVLQRYADAAQTFGAAEIVRLTGDCPLIDPDVIDAVVSLRRNTQSDYASNGEPPSFPDGLDVECFTFELLTRAIEKANRVSQLEHVTLWMRDVESGCSRANLQAVCDFSALRLTVDYPDDLQVIRELVRVLPANGQFDLFDIVREMSRNDSLRDMNRHTRNEGLALSLAQDKPQT